MSAPSVAGVSSGKMMLLLGRLPSKTLDLIRASDALAGSSYRTSNSRTLVKSLGGGEGLVTYSADLLLSLAERESLGLGEVVGEQDAVVQRVADGVVRRRGREEVGRDELRTLVHELVERVLAVRSGGAPDDRL